MAIVVNLVNKYKVDINGKKYTTSYWHLLSINVSVGDIIK